MGKIIFAFFLISMGLSAWDYQLIGLEPEILERDERVGITYFNEWQRKEYLLAVNDKGRFYYPHREQKELESYGKFVMSGKGDIYFASVNEIVRCNKSKTYIAHSSFLAGKAVAMAGFLTIKDGKITEVMNSSGHYKPPQEMINQFLNEMKLKKVKYKIKVRTYEKAMEKINNMGKEARGRCAIL